MSTTEPIAKERVRLRVYNTVESIRSMDRNYSDPPVTSAERRELDALRPKTYGDCIERGLGTRDNPCPFAGCVQNLLIDVNNNGSIIHNWPDRDFDEIPATCALRVAEYGGSDITEVGEVLNLTKQRISQMERGCMSRLHDGLIAAGVEVDKETVHTSYLLRRSQ